MSATPSAKFFGRPARRFTSEEVEQLLQLRQQGLSYPKIAQQMGGGRSIFSLRNKFQALLNSKQSFPQTPQTPQKSSHRSGDWILNAEDLAWHAYWRNRRRQRLARYEKIAVED